MSEADTDFLAVLERDQGLPGRYFTHSEPLALERQFVFESSWICIGLSADAPQKGDLFPVVVLGQPLMMVRDTNELRVFHNVCSHRGAMLVDGPRRAGPRILCPYHSWSYRLDGTLASTPHVGGADRHECPGIDAARLGLRAVRCCEWAGHVFVNLSGRAPPFEDWIRPVAERFRRVDWAELRRDPALARQLDVAANWKIIVENFVESYHVPWVHKTLNAVNPMSTHYQILGGHSYLGQGGTDYQGDQVSGTSLPLMKGTSGYSRYEALAIFPNLILSPLPDVTFSIILLPDAPERTRERLEFFYVGDEALQEAYRPARNAGAEFIAGVNAEDVRIVETVQRGRGSPAFTGGRFAPAQETTSLQFQKMIAARILSAGEAPERIAQLPTRDITHSASA
jgi:phenylpropionate dioxygenase-like ring-hydroxylating dioxygenase large terminal subunit